MPAFDKLTTLSQFDIAVHQLHRSISLFLHERDFICSISLACAADTDGILGGLLKRKGKENTHDQHKKALKKYNHGLSDKEINDLHLNTVRNEFKHATREDNETKDYALETECIMCITRGVNNYILLKSEVTSLTAEFIKWVYDNRPDVTDPNAEVEIIRP